VVLGKAVGELVDGSLCVRFIPMIQNVLNLRVIKDVIIGDMPGRGRQSFRECFD
jgi:hypothetical protein